MMERRRDGKAFLALLLGAAAILLLLSANSPLYPFNPWGDPNCFLTVARAMRAGILPYRDLMEQKGPLLYAMHIPAVMVQPNGYFGAYLLEVAACAAFLFAGYKMLRLFGYGGRWSVPLLIAAAALMDASDAFIVGGSAEELCAPMLAWSLYEALKYFHGDEGRMRAACLLRNGFLAGCVLWIKYSLLGLHFGWMAVIAVECVVRERRVWNAARMCLIFLAGMALASLPWLVYFGANGALGDLFGIYFVQNLSSYGDRAGSIPFMIEVICRRAFHSYAIGAPVLLAAAGVIFGRWANGRIKCAFLTMLFFTTAFAYYSRLSFTYMLYVWAAFVPLGLIPVLWLLRRLFENRRRAGAAAVAALSLCGCFGGLRGGYMVPWLNYPAEELPQVKFAKVISETEDATMLICGFLDEGFYTTAGVLPSQLWFCGLNILQETCYDEQARAIRGGEIDYVVTRNLTLEELGIDDSAYDMAMREETRYTVQYGHRTFYLYRRKGLDGAAAEPV